MTKRVFEAPAPDVIICDPAGMSAELVRALRKIGAERIVYVSRNPATQARTWPGSSKRTKTRCRTSVPPVPSPIEPVDMFPNTPHVETVAVLLRVDDGPRDAVDEAR